MSTAKPMDDNDLHQAGERPDPFEDGMEGAPKPDEEREAQEQERRAQAFEADAPRLSAMMDRALEEMAARASGKSKPIATPWAAVNRSLGGGLWPGFHVLSGTTGSGKSQWALEVAFGAARAGHPVLYVGLELGEVDLVARLVGLRLSQKWSNLYLGEPGAEGVVEELRQVGNEAREELDRLPFHLEIGKANGWHAGMLRPRVEALRARYPEARGKPALVVIDYLQLVTAAESERVELRERIGRAAYEARMVARGGEGDPGAAVLALSSIARTNALALGSEAKAARGEEFKGADSFEGLGKGSAARLVGFGKESGEIEYSADSVMVLARKRFDEIAKRSEMVLAMAKVRARPEGFKEWITLSFDGGRFTEASEEPAASDDRKMGGVRA